MADHDTHDHTGIPGISSGSVATDPIWDVAGDVVVGTGANTAARLAIGAVGGALSRINGAVAWNSGTSNPGSAAAGDRYWRSDLGLTIYYDGTRWLSTTLYREPFAAEMSELAHTATAGVTGRIAPWHTTYDLWLDAFFTSTFVSTTNNGTNFWAVTLNKLNAANAATQVVTFSTGTGPDTASNWVTRRTSIAALLDASTYKAMKVDLTKTLSPGALLCIGHLTYRLVVT